MELKFQPLTQGLGFHQDQNQAPAPTVSQAKHLPKIPTAKPAMPTPLRAESKPEQKADLSLEPTHETKPSVSTFYYVFGSAVAWIFDLLIHSSVLILVMGIILMNGIISLPILEDQQWALILSFLILFNGCMVIAQKRIAGATLGTKIMGLPSRFANRGNT